MKSFSGKKEKHWLKQMSRNVLTTGKSTTTLSLSRSVAKSTTPLKLMNLQKSARTDAMASSREKALLQQNIELKKKNNELVRILKKSKELIKSEVGKYKAENNVMKRFAEAAWSWAEPKLNEKLKEEMKPILVKPSTKKYSITTNSTDHCSGEKFKEDRYENELLKRRLSQKTLRTTSLMQRLNDTKQENAKLNRYLMFLVKRRDKRVDIKKELVADSENVESDEEEMCCKWLRKEVVANKDTPVAMPTFLKTLAIGNKL